MQICRSLSRVEPMEGGALVHFNCARMYVYFLTGRILRLRVCFEKETRPEASYILQATAWEDRLDPLFEGERVRLTPCPVEILEEEDQVSLSSPQMRLVIQKDPLQLSLYGEGGELIYQSLNRNPFVKDANGRLTHYSRMEEDDCFYGFGEKCGPLDKNKEYIRERATDCWSYDPVKSDTLYKHIPFYIHLSRRSGKAYGIYYNNTYEAAFNLGRERSNYWDRYSYYQTDGGELDCFLFAGPSMAEILDDYTLVTGRPAMLPKRALGYQGSSMYYSELEKDCDQVLERFVDTVRAKGFPMDGFHLSSGYTAQQGYRCVFTWNKERFPDPAGYFAAMNERGAQNVPNVKPGVLLNHPLFEEFCRQGVFIRDGEEPGKPAVGPWWGGPGAFWDYTKPEARRVWKKYLTETVIALGTDSIWDDNCEYDSLLDMDGLCDFDGAGGRVGELKAVMPTLMSRLACEAVKEYEGRRPYVVCRSGSAGIQKYAQNWVGDNTSNWENLKGNLPTLLGISLSGQPNTGADIGGFAGPAPEEELLVRWVQNGIFQPRFSIHSSSDDNTVTEPWMYKGSTERIRRAMLYRYRLLPHLYSLEWQAHLSGAPILRPLVYEFQEDERVYETDDTFLLGRDLLVAGVLEKGARVRRVYLPAGYTWYELERDFRAHRGGEEIEVEVSLDSIPRFVREGTILPMATNQIYRMQSDPVTGLSLLLVPPREGESSEYLLYDDDGVSNAFEEGAYRQTRILMEGGSLLTVDFCVTGDYPTPIKTLEVTLIHKERCPFWVSLGQERLPHFLDREAFEKAREGWYYSNTKRAVEIRCDYPQGDARLRVCFDQFNLYGTF